MDAIEKWADEHAVEHMQFNPDGTVDVDVSGLLRAALASPECNKALAERDQLICELGNNGAGVYEKLRSELAAAKRDTELLEWLFKYTATIHHTGSTQEPFWISWQSQHYRQRNRTACWATAREALYSAIIAQSDADAAMSSSQPPAQEKESQS